MFNRVVKVLLGFVVTCSMSHAALAADGANGVDFHNDMKGTWVADFGKVIQIFQIRKIEKQIGGGVAVEATYGTNGSTKLSSIENPAKVRFETLAGVTKLMVITKAESVMTLDSNGQGQFKGTLISKSGNSQAVLLTKLLMNKDILESCGLKNNAWLGTWANGGFDPMSLVILDINKDCMAAVASGNVRTDKIKVENGSFSFLCNSETGGICNYKTMGNELWASYTNPSGGRNSGIFKQIGLAE